MRPPALGAAALSDGVRDGLPEQIPELRDCRFPTLDYLLACDGERAGACLLVEPRLVLLFTPGGTEIDVHNRAWECGPEGTARGCKALFAAYPAVRRLRLNIAFPPDQLSLPWTHVRQWTYMVIDLPAGVDEYYRSLGKSTRKTLRGYRNRLERAFPHVHTETVSPDGCGRGLVERLVAWKIRRFRGQGRTTYWETTPDLVDRTVALLERAGWCRVTHISGREAAIQLCFRAGDTVFGLEGAHDPEYDAYRLGFLSMYDAVCAAIESGAKQFNATAGTAGPKEMLGARPVPTTRLTVHRSPLRRELYVLGGKVSRRPGGAALLRTVEQWRTRRAA